LRDYVKLGKVVVWRGRGGVRWRRKRRRRRRRRTDQLSREFAYV
jgi:hypothetical protein